MGAAKPRIFLCHAKEDKSRVEKLYHQLKEAGYDPWLDTYDLLPGQDWRTEIRKIITDPYNIVVVCLSPQSISKRGVVQQELKWALDVKDQQPEGSIYLIPARLEPCHVPDRLSGLHWVNLFDSNGFELLKQAIETEIGERPRSQPPTNVEPPLISESWSLKSWTPFPTTTRRQADFGRVPLLVLALILLGSVAYFSIANLDNLIGLNRQSPDKSTISIEKESTSASLSLTTQPAVPPPSVDIPTQPAVATSSISTAVSNSPTATLGQGEATIQEADFGTANPTHPSSVEYISIARDGSSGSGFRSSISPDGRYVAFYSGFTNLVPDDFDRVTDIFVRDRELGQTELIAPAHPDQWSVSLSVPPSLSSGGRYVAFETNGLNLVKDVMSNGRDSFLYDRLTGEISLVAIAPDGSRANNVSYSPSISVDGRYIAFASYASNLVPGDTNQILDIFVRDLQTNEVTRVSNAYDGYQANGPSDSPFISADGRFVAFVSQASNLVPDDNNKMQDVFVYDRQTNQSELISIANDGTQGNAASGQTEARGVSISADGRYVAFQSMASNLVQDDHHSTDIFVRDRETGQTTCISSAYNADDPGYKGYDASYHPSISANGRYVVFASNASDLVPGHKNTCYSTSLAGRQEYECADIFLYDLQTGQMSVISVAADGSPANEQSDNPSISADGQYIVFESLASNLVPGDTNEQIDIFLYTNGAVVEGSPRSE